MNLFFLAALSTSILPVQPSQPNRQTQLAAAPGLTALAFGSGNSIWFAASRDNGHNFSSPIQITQGAVLALGRHRGPRVTISGDAILVSAILGKSLAAGPHAHGLPADGDLVTWRSTDGGMTWSQPTVVNDVPAAAREGLHAIAAGPHGEIAATWLDLRATGTKLYGAYSRDNGASWSKNVLLYESPEGTICQCCDPSIVSTGNGKFQVMFRNVLGGARNMYLADWDLSMPVTKVQKLGVGSWNLNACPMDGGGLARRGKSLVTAWRRDETVYLDDPGQPEVALGEGKDVALALSPKGPYVAWVSKSGIEVHAPSEKTPVCLSPTGSFPALANLPNGSVLAAWEEDGQIHLKVLE